MGFMDKAKKMAEQAQAKIDEAQQKISESQQGGDRPQSSGPAVEYDQHGRPVNAPASAEAPPAPEPAAPPQPDPAAPGRTDTPEPAKVEGDPLVADEPGSRQGADAERDAKSPPPPSGGTPGLTSGDPLG